jgi:hypothetical protein
VDRNYQWEIEGHIVRLLGEGQYRRFHCDCQPFSAPTHLSGTAYCRHTQIISSRLAGHPIKPDPVKATATILKFAPRLRALQQRLR